MRRLIPVGVLAAVAILGGLSVIGGGGASATASFELPWTNDMNQASYWNTYFSNDSRTATCTQHLDHSGSIDAMYDAAVVKDGSTSVRVYPDLTETGAFTAQGPVNPANGLPFDPPHSWIMTCTFAPRATTTTSTSSTSSTTVPEETTTTSSTSTTTTSTSVPEETTSTTSSTSTTTSSTTVPVETTSTTSSTLPAETTTTDVTQGGPTTTSTVPDTTTSTVEQLPPAQPTTTSSTTTTTVPPRRPLPWTGGSPWQTTAVAVGVLALGALALLGSRRTSG